MAGHSVLVFSIWRCPRSSLGLRKILAMSARVDMEHTSRMEQSKTTNGSASTQLRIERESQYRRYTAQISFSEMKEPSAEDSRKSGLDLVVIDYLQLMSLGYGGDNRTNEISAITRSIKILPQRT